jgi:cation diffusion facilitator CzcD-associated flavoprotein CzcO
VGGPNGNRRELSVGIVGGGYGGVGIGARLRQAGFDRFEIFERGETVGGVWRANTYPGAACDVPSHLYSFSFAPAHHWSRRYAPQPEILRYLEDCVDRFGLRSHLRLETDVADADFDPASGR